MCRGRGRHPLERWQSFPSPVTEKVKATAMLLKNQGAANSFLFRELLAFAVPAAMSFRFEKFN